MEKGEAMVNARYYFGEKNLIKRFKAILVIGGVVLLVCLTTIAGAESICTSEQGRLEKEAKNSPTHVKKSPKKISNVLYS